MSVKKPNSNSQSLKLVKKAFDSATISSIEKSVEWIKLIVEIPIEGKIACLTSPEIVNALANNMSIVIIGDNDQNGTSLYDINIFGSTHGLYKDKMSYFLISAFPYLEIIKGDEDDLSSIDLYFCKDNIVYLEDHGGNYKKLLNKLGVKKLSQTISWQAAYDLLYMIAKDLNESVPKLKSK